MIGKPITASTIGLSPEIVVTAPALSTIDILKNSVIVQTYTLTGAETQHTFYVPLGTYVVRAPNGVETQSKTVAVDTVASYPVGFGSLKLYFDGDECAAVTGGWDKKTRQLLSWWPTTKYVCTFTKNTDNLQLYVPVVSGDGKYGYVEEANSVNTNGYSKLKILVKSEAPTGVMNYPPNLLYGSNTGIILDTMTGVHLGRMHDYEVISANISGGNFYFGFGVATSSQSGQATIYIKRIWLEK